MNAPSDPATTPQLQPLPDFLEARRHALPMTLGFGGSGFEDWRCRLLALWQENLPPCSGLPEAERDGTRLTLRFATGAKTEGCLMLPKGKPPFPAVLLLHDHGGAFELGWQKLFDLPASETGRARHYDGRAPASALLEAGFAVLCLDALGWGSRFAGGYSHQQALAANALGLGWSLAGLVAAEDIQAARWLASLAEIDPQRISAFGFSFGGFRAWQVAALSSDVGAAASVGWMAERADLMQPGAPLLKGQSAFYFLHPALAALADFPDLAGLAAGKPLFFRSGRGDPHMPEESAARAFARITSICTAAKAPAPDTGFHDYAHTCPAPVLAEAVAFLAKAAG